MRKWTRQPQEKEGDYYFEGNIYITRGIQEMLRETEIFSIVMDVLLKILPRIRPSSYRKGKPDLLCRGYKKGSHFNVTDILS